jgi:acetate kinase
VILPAGKGVPEDGHEVRARICAGLEFLGITLDEPRNTAGAPLISTDEAQTQVRVIRADEEAMMAKTGAELLALVYSA